jgi:signal peptide peptidase SppA
MPNPNGQYWLFYPEALPKYLVRPPLSPEAAAALPLSVKGRVAHIRVRGILDKGQSLLGLVFEMGSYIAIRQALTQAVADDKVSSIMLSIDSPGGSVDGIAELEDALIAARAVKPVIAQVDGMAASAAYWIAAQADKIYMHRLDMVGSIGVRMMLYDYSEMFKKDGVDAIPIDTGPFKSAGEPGTKITDEQKADFQRLADTYFASFKDAVSKGRRMAMEKLNPLADGRVFIGQDAVDKGLADGIQSFETTYSALVQEAQARFTRNARAEMALRMAQSR